MRNICVVTGSRAEYGLLRGVMQAIKQDDALHLQVIATNMHLSPRYGNTYTEIENDGFTIDYRIPLPDQNDTPADTANAIGEVIAGFSAAYTSLRPDVIVVLGDRYEILGAVTAALIFAIPVAHIHGGEVTRGAFDDAMRHAITKMSHLHFAATPAYCRRIVQLGEEPKRVFYTGALGVENIKTLALLEEKTLQQEIGFEWDNNLLCITYHPVTLQQGDVARQCDALLEALEQFPTYQLLFTLPNSDTGSTVITDKITRFVAHNPSRAVAYTSLGVVRYLSLLKYATAVVGNSSSGIIEAPSFGIPTLDIGERQSGRMAADSVLHTTWDKESIVESLHRILSPQWIAKSRHTTNPYDKAHTAERIVQELKACDLGSLVIKTFYDVDYATV